MSSLSTSSSNDKPLKGENIAILVATGFSEPDVMDSMRALADTGAKITLIAPETGLVQGWNGAGFGHSHAVDAPLSNALAADYSMLLVASGGHAMDKLKTSAHTTRFIKGFLSYGNPAAFFGDAVQLLAHVGLADGKTVTGPDAQQSLLAANGATWSDEAVTIHDQILTGAVDTPEALKNVIIATVAHFMNIPAEMRLAA
jgi:protease I